MTEKLLSRGGRIAATARSTAGLSDLAARHGELLWTRELDVTDTAAVRDVIARAFAGRTSQLAEPLDARRSKHSNRLRARPTRSSWDHTRVRDSRSGGSAGRR